MIPDTCISFCLSEVAIALRVDKELERGCAQGILQIVGEEVQPGKREQQQSPCSFFVNPILVGMLRRPILIQVVVRGQATLIRIIRNRSPHRVETEEKDIASAGLAERR